MNNKGQTLILFLIVLPLILIVLLSIYQVATISLEKRKINDSIIKSLEYGIEKIKDEDVEEKIIEIILLENSNLDEKNIEIIKSNYEIKIVITKKYSISFIKEEEILISYTGKKVDGKLEIIKNRG